MYKICIIGSGDNLEQVRIMQELLLKSLETIDAVTISIRDPEKQDLEQEILDPKKDSPFNAWFWQLKTADLIIVAEPASGENEHAPITKMEIAAAVSYDVPILHAVMAADVSTVIKADILNKKRLEKYQRIQIQQNQQSYGLNMALKTALTDCSYPVFKGFM